LARLQDFMRDIHSHAFHLELTSPASEYADVADKLHEAFCVARELSRPRNVSGCPKHPGAPVDPDAPDGKRCLFCQGAERRKSMANAPVTLPPIKRGDRRSLQRRFPRPIPKGDQNDQEN
jgi:hypothetical protein